MRRHSLRSPLSLPNVGCRMSLYNVTVRMTRYVFKVK